MERLSARWQSAIILVVALLCAVLCVLLPEDPYQRWQLLDGTIHRRARWMYERIHYDPTPIDVVFVGPSRIAAGINAPLLSSELAARRLPANVVNFALPETGRNINTVILAETLKAKRPKLVVIGVIEKPSRLGHSAFKYIAPAQMMIDPGYVGDLNYFSDLIYLPYRQMYLFIADLFPDAVGLAKTFDAAQYASSSIEATAVPLPGGQVADTALAGDPANIERGVRKLEAGMRPPLLPARLADIEFGDERHNVREIVRMARAGGARVAFVMLPYYSSTRPLQDRDFYGRYGPIWDAGFVASREGLFWDYGHLTTQGARLVTTWLAPRVAAMLKQPR